jgi:hypothetical protein
VFGAVHLAVEATLDPETSRVSPPTVLVYGAAGGGKSPEDQTAVECDTSCQDSLHSVRLTIELRDALEHDVRLATRELFSRLERAKLVARSEPPSNSSIPPTAS